VRFREILHDLREAFTIPTKGSLVKAIILILGVVAIALVISFLLFQLLPDEQQMIDKLKPYGYLAVFLITLVSSMTVVVPIPGIIIWVSIAVAIPLNLPLAALIAAVGGTMGEVTAYYIGRAGRAIIAPEQSERYQIAERWMKRHGGIAVGLFAFLPILIFDFVGIAAGVLRYPIRKFLLYCWLGRFPRSLVEVYFFYFTEKTILDFLFRL
jgi:membrane protein YqaA with SNARE-associated domain